MIVTNPGGLRGCFVGDSNTAGSPDYDGGWREPLMNATPGITWVGRNSYDTTLLVETKGCHEGYGGAQTGNFMTGSNLEAAFKTYLDAAKPHIIMASLGTNNVAGGDTAAQIVTKLTDMGLAFAALSYVMFVIFSDIPPRGPLELEAAIATTNEFNGIMVSSLTGIHAKVKAFTNGSLLNNTTDLNADGVHLSAQGKAKTWKRHFVNLSTLGIPLAAVASGLGPQYRGR